MALWVNVYKYYNCYCCCCCSIQYVLFMQYRSLQFFTLSLCMCFSFKMLKSNAYVIMMYCYHWKCSSYNHIKTLLHKQCRCKSNSNNNKRNNAKKTHTRTHAYNTHILIKLLAIRSCVIAHKAHNSVITLSLWSYLKYRQKLTKTQMP